MSWVRTTGARGLTRRFPVSREPELEEQARPREDSPRDDHGDHAGHSPEVFRDRFWVSLALTGPILYHRSLAIEPAVLILPIRGRGLPTG
jgi:hypothetical protein